MKRRGMQYLAVMLGMVMGFGMISVAGAQPRPPRPEQNMPAPDARPVPPKPQPAPDARPVPPKPQPAPDARPVPPKPQPARVHAKHKRSPREMECRVDLMACKQDCRDSRKACGNFKRCSREHQECKANCRRQFSCR